MIMSNYRLPFLILSVIQVVSIAAESENGSNTSGDESSPFTRLLLHPHVGEQPFTRSQSALSIPPDITVVKVRAHDLVDGFGGREVTVDLNKSRGDDFVVIRKK